MRQRRWCRHRRHPVDTLGRLAAHFRNYHPIEPYRTTFDLTDRRRMRLFGHHGPGARQAPEVAAAGGHNCLMTGSPGAGKTPLALRCPPFCPADAGEALDVTRIYSVADMLHTVASDAPLIRHRPFRAPHHTISHAGLVGGGQWPRPGEISLAHRGVLFLDEMPEFSSHTLEVLRQPLEDKVVTISRAQGSLTFPANFMLVAAMNPCPCVTRVIGAHLHVQPRFGQQVPEAAVRPVARPHRHSRRGAAPFQKLSDERRGNPRP